MSTSTEIVATAKAVNGAAHHEAPKSDKPVEADAKTQTGGDVSKAEDKPADEGKADKAPASKGGKAAPAKASKASPAAKGGKAYAKADPPKSGKGKKADSVSEAKPEAGGKKTLAQANEEIAKKNLAIKAKDLAAIGAEGRITGGMFNPDTLVIAGEGSGALEDPRAFYDIPKDFIESIDTYGVQEPIEVSLHPTEKNAITHEPQVYVVNGRQRVRAAQIVNRQRAEKGIAERVSVPAIVVPWDENRFQRAVIFLNEYRINTKPLDKAASMERLLGGHQSDGKGGLLPKMKREEVAKLYRITTKTVQRYLNLRKNGAPEVVKALEDGDITLNQAFMLTRGGYSYQQQIELLAKLRAGERAALPEDGDAAPPDEGESEGGEDKPKKNKLPRITPVKAKKLVLALVGTKSHPREYKNKSQEATAKCVRVAIDFAAGNASEATFWKKLAEYAGIEQPEEEES